MSTLYRTSSAVLAFVACLALTPGARADRRAKSKPASQADLERLEKKVEAQQKVIDRLLAIHRQYLQSLAALVDNTPSPAASDRPAEPVAAPAPAPPVEAPTADASTRPAEPRAAAAKPSVATSSRSKSQGSGTVVGKVTGAGDAVIYIEDIVSSSRGTAEMKQEGKQFLPKVLVVQKGTKVGFPNRDAIFHNVFSVSPDNSFDLGSYRQGETKTVTMTRAGVITVYCNMHPQMVGHILVVPNGNFVRAGADGFFRLTNVPAGTHRVVAWAPNAKPARVQTTVGDDEVVTIEVALSKSGSTMHTKKDGLPYGSYDQ